MLIRPAKIAFAEWRPFMGSLLLAGLGGVLLAVVLSFLLARRLTRPIGELSAATRRLARGEADVAVPVRGEDELADLGTSFNEMSDELSRAREAQGRFLESVSHELRTPLTSIRGYAEALEEEAIPPAESARVIGAEADRLERLVADLLDLARFGRSGFSVSREPVDLAGVVEEAVERHLPRAREIGVELSGAGAPGDWVLGDHDRILQAVSNLIENALRLTPAGGSVAVRAAGGAITVRDTGPGLDPEDIPHAFERFYLYGRYRSERPVGSGLGLAIVQELISAMGGTVEASSPAHGPGTDGTGGTDGAGGTGGAGGTRGASGTRGTGGTGGRAGPSSGSGCRLYRRAPLGQMLSDLPLDPLQRVVDGLAVAADPPPDLLVGMAVEVQREHAGLELGQRSRDAGDERAELL